MLHLHCGDSSANTLRETNVPGEVAVWCDPVIDGPAPAGVEGDDWIALRAEHLAKGSGGALTADRLTKWLRSQQDALETFPGHEEVVLWFDACLFDQTILIRQLDWFGRQDMGGTTLSLICVGEFPGFGRFAGLGELNPEQMASLLDTRHEVTPEEIGLGISAWAAFRSADPTAIERVVAEGTSALPYLGDALVRHLEQFPSARNGLNRLENEALEVIVSGETKLGPIFVGVSAKEERPFIGDTFLWGCLDELARGEHPLLDIEGPGRLPLWRPEGIGRWTVRLTEAGRQVLAGEADWVELNGIDRWLGGVHLCGNEAEWRWDENARKIVSTPVAG